MSGRLLSGRQAVYIDLGFLDELRTQFGARGGPFAQAYVIAHEYGHHVQDSRVRSPRAGTRRGPAGGIGADRVAGRLLRRRVGEPRRADGLYYGGDERRHRGRARAAAAVGDDRIQSETQGQVNPETWTHGSSAQRKQWFTVGFKSAKLAACNTFKGSL